MVIGNGMVATRFESYQTNPEFVIFGSGVSNSKNTDAADYDRETDLLKKIINTHQEKTIVYFSTCSIYDPGQKDNLYCVHKLKTEAYIQKKANRYYIFRVSNLVGQSANQHTIPNFFYYHMKNKTQFDLWVNSTRNLIDTDDMFTIVDHILHEKLYSNQIINVANPESYEVKEIIIALESILNQKVDYLPIMKGTRYQIDITLIMPVIGKLKINFGKNYLTGLIKKYYPHQ